MSAPQKPWEIQNTNQRPNPGALGQGRNTLNSYGPAPRSGCYGPTMNAPPVAVSQRASSLPPLPQRPPQLFNRPSFGVMSPGFGGYGGYTTGYGGYGASSYGGYGGMYGGYGYGGYGGPMGMGGGFENRFLQVAEESSRDAFQSIESIVRAFSSVSMMLESTYYAMYSSFRAVLGVVDNFSRLRQIFVQFLSTITVLRIIRNFYRQLLYWLGVLDHSPQAEQVWESVNGPAGDNTQVASSPKWPLLTFLAFLFGGPYIISKFFSSNNPSGKQWDFEKGKYVKTAYPHQAGTDSELSFQANEKLNLAPAEMQPLNNNGWLLASNMSGQVGYVPITRVGMIMKSKPVAHTHETASAEATPVPAQEDDSRQSNDEQCGKQWDFEKGKYVKTAYSHQAGSDSELSFQANEKLNLAPAEMQPLNNNGWLWASNMSGQVGYVPITRVGVIMKSKPAAHTLETASAEATLVPAQEDDSRQSNDEQCTESQERQW